MQHSFPIIKEKAETEANIRFEGDKQNAKNLYGNNSTARKRKRSIKA
jgi:hypothetical protein